MCNVIAREAAAWIQSVNEERRTGHDLKNFVQDKKKSKYLQVPDAFFEEFGMSVLVIVKR